MAFQEKEGMARAAECSGLEDVLRGSTGKTNQRGAASAVSVPGQCGSGRWPYQITNSHECNYTKKTRSVQDYSLFYCFLGETRVNYVMPQTVLGYFNGVHKDL